MSSPLKPLTKALRILGFLLGSGVDFDKFKESGGLVFQRSKLWLIKIVLIFSQMTVATSLLFGYILFKKMK